MAAASSPWTPNWKRRKLNEDNSRAIQHHWPEGVIKEILVRLPARSILRFKSVCKSWHSLIRSRYFLELYSTHRLLLRGDDHNKLFFSWLGKHSFHVFSMDPSSSSSLSESPTPLIDVGRLLKAVRGLNRDQIVKSFSIVGLPLAWEAIAEVFEPNMQVLGPLNNGIYAVISEVFVHTRKSKLITGYCNVAFCNPATGDFKILLNPPVLRWPSTKQYYGFGSIQKATNGVDIVLDYKMVVITQVLDQSYKAYVYSQRRGGRWKRFEHSHIWKDYREVQFPAITENLDFLPQAFVNGYCHWMAGHSSVLRFDITKEVFGLIPGPPNNDPNLTGACHIRRGVFAINDHLAAIIIQDDLLNTTHTVDVWMMKEYGIEKSWTRIHSSAFHFKGLLNKFLGMFFSRDNQVIERIFFQLKRGIVLSYDCSAGILSEHFTPGSSISRWTTKEKDGYDGSWACWKTIGLARYVETLEPVDLEGKDEYTI